MRHSSGNTTDLTQVNLELKGILDTVLGDEDRNLAVVQNTGRVLKIP